MSINIETITTPQKTARGPAEPTDASAVYLGTKNRMPEFVLTDKVVLVSGAGRGLGLTQAEALLEAGAIVYALDRLPEPVCLVSIITPRIVLSVRLVSIRINIKTNGK